jgi:hypothetical protein
VRVKIAWRSSSLIRLSRWTKSAATSNLAGGSDFKSSTMFSRGLTTFKVHRHDSTGNDRDGRVYGSGTRHLGTINTSLVLFAPKATPQYNEFDDTRHQLAMASRMRDRFTPRLSMELPSRASGNGA